MKDLAKHIASFASKHDEHAYSHDAGSGWVHDKSHPLELVHHLTKHGYKISDHKVDTKHALHADGATPGETHIYKVHKDGKSMHVVHASDKPGHEEERYHSAEVYDKKPSIKHLKSVPSFSDWLKSNPKEHAKVKGALAVASGSEKVPPKHKLN